MNHNKCEKSLCWWINEDVGDPDPVYHLTEGIITLESLKLSEPKKLFVCYQPVRRSISTSLFGLSEVIKSYVKLANEWRSGLSPNSCAMMNNINQWVVIGRSKKERSFKRSNFIHSPSFLPLNKFTPAL